MCPAIARTVLLSSSRQHLFENIGIENLSKSSPTLAQFQKHENREEISHLKVSAPTSPSICLGGTLFSSRSVVKELSTLLRVISGAQTFNLLRRIILVGT